MNDEILDALGNRREDYETMIDASDMVAEIFDAAFNRYGDGEFFDLQVKQAEISRKIREKFAKEFPN